MFIRLPEQGNLEHQNHLILLAGKFPDRGRRDHLMLPISDQPEMDLQSSNITGKNSTQINKATCITQYVIRFV